MLNIQAQIAKEINIKFQQVKATVDLLNEGATVPFIARYRKEATGNLDDIQLRALQEKLTYYTELEDRKISILNSIKEQEKLTPELEQQINQCLIKQTLEDLYLPFKPKRRTKGQIAIENGLLPLANSLFENQNLVPQQEAGKYLTENILDIKSALDGARDILAEEFAQTASLLELLRNKMWQAGVLTSSVIEGQESGENEKFKDYYDFSQTLQNMPSHRVLAVLRGRNLGILNLKLEYPDLEVNQIHPMEILLAQHMGIKSHTNAYEWLKQVCKWTWRVKLNTIIELELVNRAKEIAEKEAINIFAQNLKQLLMAAPAGFKATMGLDPGIRTGVKVAVVDSTGKLLDTTTIYPHPPKQDIYGSIVALEKLIKKYNIELIAIGNGTASRETEKLTLEIIKKQEFSHVQKIIVNESGASIYSASEFASRELPDLDVSLRGAVSIARRLQDPLAELVKIPPESIGVGQYQHDLDAKNLSLSLNNVVEDCVNAVGVDVNTASAALLEKVSGLNSAIAKNIVIYRDENGKFTNRKQLKKVPRLGDKTFEQSAGFLRIQNGDEPLDASSVHPESYAIAYKIISNINHPINQLIGNSEIIKKIDINPYISEICGRETLKDILKEFEKPGRDPRPSFRTANLAEGINEIKDLQIDMELEGTVTNVTAFGAFVDIGVHQDGLVHISELANEFISNPNDVVKAGQIVKVRVKEVDISRKRIALSMRNKSNKINNAQQKSDNYENTTPKKLNSLQNNNNKIQNPTSLSEAFAKLKRK